MTATRGSSERRWEGWVEYGGEAEEVEVEVEGDGWVRAEWSSSSSREARELSVFSTCENSSGRW